MFSATFLPTESDERQRSGWIKAAGRWCVRAFTSQTLKLQRQVKSKEEEMTWFNHFMSSSIDQNQKILVSLHLANIHVH